MGENEIGGLGRTRPDGQDGGTPFYARLRRGGQAQPETEAPVPAAKPRRDLVELTPPVLAALELLRQRVHDATCQRLDLPARREEHRFHSMPSTDTDVVLGRILGDQGQLAAQREAGGGWLWPRIEQALHEGLNVGVEETLAILDDLGQLDEVTWRAVCGVLDLLGERLKRVAGG